ncbi:MAG: hypothetical protein AB1486_23055 [Planctomycetota bacterium]
MRTHSRDLLLAVGLGLGAGFVTFLGASRLDPVLYDSGAFDVWFDADIPRVFEDMIYRMVERSRSTLHPLFTLIVFPPAYVLKKLPGLELVDVVRVVSAGMAGLWIAALFALLRRLGCRCIDAVLFTILAAVSAASVFGLTILETFAFGSFTILVALHFMMASERRPLGDRSFVAVTCLTLTATVTNAMAGLLVTLANRRIRSALQITIYAVLIVVALTYVQGLFFPTVEQPSTQPRGVVTQHVLRPESGGVLHVLQAFCCHSMVMPEIGTTDIHVFRPFRLGWERMTVQLSAPGSASLWGLVAVVLWLALLFFGLGTFLRDRQHPRLRLVLGLLLLGQFALHVFFGYETFLYSLHYIPLLIVLAAWSTLSRARIIGRVLACMLVATASINNVAAFERARTFVTDHVPERHVARMATRARLGDLWPKSEGHVLLAWPGSRWEEKGYHEPGGSFSPGPGSCGISIWVLDAAGEIKTSSDTIPKDQIEQHLLGKAHKPWADRMGAEGGMAPRSNVSLGIVTSTRHYVATWVVTGPGRFELKLEWPPHTSTRPAVVIRSVGPAGGQTRLLDWNGERLLVNNRWCLTPVPLPAKVTLGEEGGPGWKHTLTPESHWESMDGWGFARIDIESLESRLIVTDFAAKATSPLDALDLGPAPELRLPDEQFVECLEAQAAHLLMGLVEKETRPADPTDYPVPSTREGSYITVALLRMGYLELARELSTHLAVNDFLGPFGPEADSPGYAIWALVEVAHQLGDPGYAEWLWPHVQRKAEWILRMLATDRPIYQRAAAPVMAQLIGSRVVREDDPSLLAEPARDGLVAGRMDRQTPLLFVSAACYRGLLDGASLGEALGKSSEAALWRAQAEALRAAWETAFQETAAPNPWTYVNCLWPTWIASSRTELLADRLYRQWTERHTGSGALRQIPAMTYADVAEAHQWLFLGGLFFGRADRAWATLRWLWDHQASPGLYTWWEANTKRIVRGLWDGVRGWIDPPHSTPQYWTAAEMVLLQLDMLAYVEPSPGESSIIVGAGIPASWLAHPMQVARLPLHGVEVSWSWDTERMRVVIRGGRARVRLGPIFDPGTPLDVDYEE